jgi:hypothetical protein
MARFSGKVGYGTTIEDPEGSGVWVPHIEEVQYYGDVVRESRNLEKGDKVNNDISVSVSISIIADQHAIEHYLKIKYVWWEGVRWMVTNVAVQRPRLILSLGSVYNGPVFVAEEEDEPPP